MDPIAALALLKPLESQWTAEEREAVYNRLMQLFAEQRRINEEIHQLVMKYVLRDINESH